MLVIKSLTVENIGIFTNKRTFTFSNGVNLINGSNGHGKSTIINTISMLLLNSYDGNLESCLNNNSDKGYGELQFTYNDNDYKSSIKIAKSKKSTTSSKELYKNDNLIAEGEDVEKELFNLFAPTLTEYSLFCKQHGLKLTSISDSDRRAVLTQLCELDYSRKVKDIVEDEIEVIKGQINDYEKQQYALQNKTYNLMEQKQLNDWDDDKQNRLDELIANQDLYEKNVNLTREIRDLNFQLHDAHDELEKKTLEYSEEKINQRQSKELDEENDKYTKLMDCLTDKFNQSIKKNDDDIESLMNEIAEVEKKLSTIKVVKLVKFNESQLSDARNDLTKLKSENKYIIDELNKLQYNLEKIESGICPYRGE